MNKITGSKKQTPDSLRREASQAAGAAPTLRNGRRSPSRRFEARRRRNLPPLTFRSRQGHDGLCGKTLIQDETGLATGVGKRPLLRLKPGEIGSDGSKAELGSRTGKITPETPRPPMKLVT